jgi:hypothetical protein
MGASVSGFSNIIAYGFSEMAGLGGLGGWQWVSWQLWSCGPV